MDRGSDRTLDLAQFLDFMLNFSASLSDSSIIFHDLANAITISKCRRDVTDQDIKDLFIDEGKRFSAIRADETGFEDIATFGKLERLFRLMDKDKSGYLDQCELALGMRKFTSYHDDLSKSLDECTAAIQTVDDDGDGQLDVREFAKLIAKFANSAQVEMHHLINFVMVQCSMKSNSKQKEDYSHAHRKLHGPENRNSHVFTAVRSMLHPVASKGA
jgi:hypothetical protein